MIQCINCGYIIDSSEFFHYHKVATCNKCMGVDLGSHLEMITDEVENKDYYRRMRWWLDCGEDV
jgi:uncharacterized membrane protein